MDNKLTKAKKKAVAEKTAVNNALQNIYGGKAADTTATTLGTYHGGSTPWVNTTDYDVGSLSPEVTTSLGLTADQAAQLQAAMAKAGTTQYMSGHNFGAGSGTAQIDLSQFLSQIDPAQALTAANVATPEQYARAKALETLAGSPISGMALDPTQSNLASTAPTAANTFDYKSALDTATQTAAEERQAAQEAANQISAGADLAHAQSKHNHGGFRPLKNAVTHPGTLA